MARLDPVPTSMTVAANATVVRRRLTFLAVATVLGLFAAVQALYFTRGFVPGDAYVYLAAGERLNAGHELYALMPGDRPVGLKPPFWTVPLLSPPPIAVIWRPLAALPNESGAYLWWAGSIAAVGGTMVALLRRQPLATAGAILLLMFPLVYEIGVGNVQALLLLGSVLVWRLFIGRRDVPAGAIVGLMVAVKLTPAVLAWWLLTQRRWRAAGAVVLTGVAVLAISIAGAGWDVHLEYLNIVRSTSAVGTSDLSLGGVARFVGVPADIAAWLPRIALVVGLVLVWALRARPALAFAVTVATVVLGSPVVNVNWYAYLLAMLAPFAWPQHPRAEGAK